MEHLEELDKAHETIFDAENLTQALQIALSNVTSGSEPLDRDGLEMRALIGIGNALEQTLKGIIP